MSSYERETLEDPAYLGAASADPFQSGWLTFAGLALEFVGLFNASLGFIALFRSAYFSGTVVYGSLTFWSLVWIGIGVLQIAAGIGILGAKGWARWFGMVMVLISAAANLLSIAEAPLSSIFIIFLDLMVLYAVIIRWPRSRSAPAA